ncbi:FCD domain-containing protein [Saxibacter everestensis]|uniref:FCD domain-containing protein n=1 Tax=Saxibacter everestensis TaxID=2909229 RepID=A0ABY8QWH9_9MICO|nr:FCD domain-containing protein [Brevibacteriaceae bacterium ZFBP1038]
MFRYAEIAAEIGRTRRSGRIGADSRMVWGKNMSVWSGLRVNDQSVPDQLSHKLIERIESGVLEEGVKLPSERGFIELTGASRTSIREALHDLERRGYVKRIPRVGTVVSRQDRPAMDQNLFGDLSHSQRVIREVMDLRSVIEPPIAGRAATRRSDGELVLLREPLEAAEAELAKARPSVTEMQRLDVAFHSGIARLSHNAMLTRLMDVTSEWMAPSRGATLQTERRMRLSVGAHRSIYEAVRIGDPAKAAAAMSDHIADVSESINALHPIDEKDHEESK